MENPTLVILAAGMASRYGSNKQTEAFGPSGETIMEYSIYDAIKAGFGKVVFIIRKDGYENFKAQIESKISPYIEIDYAFQDLHAYLGNHSLPPERQKPFGTAHALLCARNHIQAPFAVINADDFYGAEAFEKAFDFLTQNANDGHYASIGYILKNTLSDHGAVTRGEIKADAQNKIISIQERKQIFNINGQPVIREHGSDTALLPLTPVSMNFFCFTAAFIDFCADRYDAFLDKNLHNPTSEFLIPELVDSLIKESDAKVELITTTAQWFGVTYKDDANVVRNKLASLIEQAEYPANLWSQLAVNINP